jgi:hypothetical protein
MLFFGSDPPARLADKLRVSDERLQLFHIKMTRATSHRTHLLIVTNTSLGFVHLQAPSSLLQFT